MAIYVNTGANRGLGIEFVRQLSATSSNEIIAGTRSQSSDLSELEGLRSENKNIHILECDIGSIASIESFADQIKALLGASKKIDFILNNAGLNSVPTTTSLNIPQDAFEEHMMVNILGPAKLVENLVSHLQRGSVIMNMSSGLGSLEFSKHNGTCPLYSVSKVGLNMLTIHQAKDLKSSEVIVVCMDPGWVRTRMGGPAAVLAPHESISGILNCIHGLKQSDTGKFYTYTGREVSW